ncbi:tellurite resistance TerB family protein [Xanthobacter sp. TB0139]|uniref:tellurite resistance TerB family protein n=1 Tax=Xanthobacter sp. TB0139 TaxID=3459178 RepID=UPI0040393C9D
MADAGSLLGQLLGAALSNGSVRRGGQSGNSGGLQGALGEVLGQVLSGGGVKGSSTAQQGGAGGMLGDILGQVLGGGAPQGGARPQGNASGLPGGLGDILGQVLGGGSSSQGGAASGGLPGGLGDLLGQVLGGGAAQQGSTSASRGGSGGGLSDMVTDALGSGGSVPASVPSSSGSAPVPAPMPQQAPSGNTSGGKAAGGNDLVKYGGLAVIGMLAFNAFRKWQAQQGGGASRLMGDVEPSDTTFAPEKMPGGPEAFSAVLLSAMTAAAQADGEIDADELKHITQGLAKVGASTDDREALMRYLTTPVNPQTLIDAATTPQAAMEIYAVSAMSIRVDSVAEQQYLAGLAQALNIDAGLKAQIDRDLNAA